MERSARVRFVGPLLRRFLPAAALLVGCSNIQSSTVRTSAAVAPYHGSVRVVTTTQPAGRELGLVQVAGPRPVDELMGEFRAKVSNLGGSVGVVDVIASRFEMSPRVDTYWYGCGYTTASRTCPGSRTVTDEVMTVQILGRAFSH